MKGEVRGRLASQLAGVTMTLTQLLGAVMTGVSSPGACKAAVGGRTGEEGAGGESLRRLWDGADVESAAEPLLGAQTVPHVKAFGVLPAVGGLSGEGSASPPSCFLLCQRSLPRFGYPSEPRRHYILDTFPNWLIEKCLLNYGRYS